MEIQWTDLHPDTGEKVYLEARHFAKEWNFFIRYKRRSEWEAVRYPTLAMWEHVLDALKRKYPRRDGAEIHDIEALERHLKKIRPGLEAWEEKRLEEKKKKDSAVDAS